MALSTEHTTQLIERFLSDQLDPDEIDAFFDLVQTNEIRAALESSVDDSIEQFSFADQVSESDKQRLLLAIEERGNMVQRAPVQALNKVHFSKMNLFRYAAALVLIAGACAYLYLEPVRKNQVRVTQKAGPQDVPAPSSSHAVLTLSGGRQILLDSSSIGEVAVENSTNITRPADGQLIYSAKLPSQQSDSESKVRYNTLTVPRGSQATSLVLSDGSRVLLNAASSLTYPVAFTGGERKIEMTGEVYFEIAHDPARKFVVKAQGLRTEVLGTHFNINSYPDEGATRITLLEGKVNVITSREHLILQPGQQAQATANGILERTDKIDLDEVTAWRKGMFLFKKANPATILRQVERWYDITVRYAGPVPEVTLSGGLSRNLPLSDLVELLRTNGIHCYLEKKILTVQPKYK
jgi:transmembrane sensor